MKRHTPGSDVAFRDNESARVIVAILLAYHWKRSIRTRISMGCAPHVTCLGSIRKCNSTEVCWWALVSRLKTVRHTFHTRGIESSSCYAGRYATRETIHCRGLVPQSLSAIIRAFTWQPTPFSDVSRPSLKQNDHNRGLPTGELLSLIGVQLHAVQAYRRHGDKASRILEP